MRDLDADVDLKLPEIKQREVTFERKLHDRLEAGGLMKFVKLKPTIEGFPDRLAIGFRRTRLVEIKREGESLSEMQVLVHRDLRKMGVKVLVIHGPDVEEAAYVIEMALRRGS